MTRFRFSIASLMALVLFVAVAVAALRQADDIWDSGMFTLSASLLLAGVLRAIHRSGRRRAFWLGFALFGSAYLIASLIPPVESRLLTTKGLAYLDSKVPGRPASPNTVQAVAFSPQGSTLATSSQGVVRLWNTTTGTPLAGPSGSREHFIRIGHSLLALVLAFCGGRFSLRMFVGENESMSEADHEQRPGS